MTAATASPTRAIQFARSRPVLLLGLLACAELLGLALMSSIAFGAADIAAADVWAALVHFDPSSTEHLIIRTLRVPRAVIAALVGAALVGPNGCGKSTLLRGIARLLAPRGGATYLDGRVIHRIPTRELARLLGILPQSPVAPEGLTVHELVAQGRYPHQAWFKQWAAEDEAAMNRALEITGMAALADRPVDALSGGQRQRAWIAMTLAQETSVILLDEPTTFLDLAHQIEVLQLLERLNRDEGRTIVMVVHDLNHATRHAHHLIALRDGRLAAAGPPAEVVTPALLRQVFGVEAEVVPDPRSGVPLCVAYGLAADAASHVSEPPKKVQLSLGETYVHERL